MKFQLQLSHAYAAFFTYGSFKGKIRLNLNFKVSLRFTNFQISRVD